MSCNLPYSRSLRQREDTRHQQQIAATRGQVDTKAATARKKSKGKGERLRADRALNIQRENNFLLRRMLNIDLKPSSTVHRTQPQSHRVSSASLNRIRHLSTINHENQVPTTQGLFTRLQRVTSVYSVRQWQRESEVHAYLSHNLSRNSGHIAVLGGSQTRPNTVSGSRGLRTRQSSRPRTEGGRTVIRTDTKPL